MLLDRPAGSAAEKRSTARGRPVQTLAPGRCLFMCETVIPRASSDYSPDNDKLQPSTERGYGLYRPVTRHNSTNLPEGS